jgi:hypothetical protein
MVRTIRNVHFSEMEKVCDHALSFHIYNVTIFHILFKLPTSSLCYMIHLDNTIVISGHYYVFWKNYPSS